MNTIFNTTCLGLTLKGCFCAHDFSTIELIKPFQMSSKSRDLIMFRSVYQFYNQKKI